MTSKRVLILAAAAAFGVALTACKAKPSTAGPDAAAVIASAEPKTSTPPRPKPLPPEPPPPMAGSYDGGALMTFAEVTAKHGALKDIWEPAHRDQLRTLLSVVSTMLETLEPDGNSELSLPMWKKAQALKLDGATIELTKHISVTGKLPADFSALLGKHLSDVKAEPHLGTWKAADKSGDIGFDLSALASWTRGCP